jgi:hypothetical protein
VPYLWDKTPDAELNPLTNPALERNLSRWAEVYFSSPPGKRDAAINKLLQEIRSETFETLKAESLKAEPARREEPPQTQESQTQESQAVCPTCRHSNPREHKFCRECGGKLNAIPQDWRNSLNFRATRFAAEPYAARSGNGVQWVRDRSLGTFYGAEASRRGLKYAVGGLVIAALAGFAYMQWAPQLKSELASPATTAAPQVTAGKSSLQASKPPLPVENVPAAAPAQATLPASKPPAVQPAAVSTDTNTQKAAPAAPAEVQRAVQRSSMLPAAPRQESAAGDSGAADLRLAQRYLQGSMGTRDSTVAAKLLWQAVRKQNLTASVLLSDLYLRGDGVPKSCDQARLLLVAASRRGAPQAAEQLRRLQSLGCR